MTHVYYHAKSTSRVFGGKPEDYLAIHQWFDETKEHFADFRHRALRHHAEGIFECERIFGVTVTNSEGKEVPVRYIGEQHVLEDCGGRIPSLSEFSCGIDDDRSRQSSPILGRKRPSTDSRFNAGQG